MSSIWLLWHMSVVLLVKCSITRTPLPGQAFGVRNRTVIKTMCEKRYCGLITVALALSIVWFICVGLHQYICMRRI